MRPDPTEPASMCGNCEAPDPGAVCGACSFCQWCAEWTPAGVCGRCEVRALFITEDDTATLGAQAFARTAEDDGDALAPVVPLPVSVRVIAETVTLSACSGCLMSAEGVSEDIEERGRFIHGATAQGLGDYLTHTADPETGEDPAGGFSWEPCEVCGDTLGGDRHGLVFIVPDPEDW